MLWIGGRSQATGAIPVLQRVVERVSSFHHLLAGKSKINCFTGTQHQLCSTLVANMTRQSHLQLFGREHLEKGNILKNAKCRFEKIHHQI